MSKTTVRAEATATEEWLDSLDPAQIKFRDASHIREIMAAKEARDEADARLSQAVAAARAAGDSWTVVGAALGVSKQAAQQRYREPARREHMAPAIIEASTADAGHALVVVPQGSGCWGIKVQGGRAVDIAETQQAAITTARDVVKNHGGGNIVVHGRDGRIRQVIQVKKVASPRA